MQNVWESGGLMISNLALFGCFPNESMAVKRLNFPIHPSQLSVFVFGGGSLHTYRQQDCMKQFPFFSPDFQMMP